MVERYLGCVSYVDLNKEYRDVDDQRFSTDHNVFCYNEDTWTKRLYAAVATRYSNDYVEYTAPLRGKSCNDAVLQKMPKGTPIDCLIFHGSPDILIKYKPLTVENEDGIGCIETKKCESATYSAHSMIPLQSIK